MAKLFLKSIIYNIWAKCAQFLIILLRYKRKIKSHFLSAQTEIQILKYCITYLGVSHCHFTGLNLKNILRHPKFSNSIEGLKSYKIVILKLLLRIWFFWPQWIRLSQSSQRISKTIFIWFPMNTYLLIYSKLESACSFKG